jgi:hypothetical protein
MVSGSRMAWRVGAPPPKHTSPISETVVREWFVARRAIAAASGGPSLAISRRQNLEIALLRSGFQRLPLLQQHHAVQCQVERSIAVMRYQR